MANTENAELTGEPQVRCMELLERLNDRLRNAHYWITERPAIEQAQSAILEARGITMELAENLAGTNLTLMGRPNGRISNGGESNQ